MTAFVNHLRKTQSYPHLSRKLPYIQTSHSDSCLLSMSMFPISPRSVKKELLYGSIVATASVFLQDQHHHLPTIADLYQSITFESIDTLNRIYENKTSKLNKIINLKKNYLLFWVIMLPFLIRFCTIVSLEYVM